LEELRED